MYILRNAVKSITRNKARNFLIAVIVLVIAVSSCIALSIRQAAETARSETLAGMSITAQISFDREKMMSQMQGEDPPQPGEEGSRPNFDLDELRGETLTLEDYLTYTAAQSEGDSYYYTAVSSLDASGDLLPYGTEEDEETESSEEAQPEGNPEFPIGGGGRGDRMPFSVQGDFSLTGYSSYTAMLSLFGEDGTYSITDGQMFAEATGDMTCVISNELAMYNGLSVGDEITLANPNYEDETYTLTISGIYTNTASGEGNSMFSRSDPANNIYVSYETLKAMTDQSAELGNVMTTEDEEEVSAVLNSELNFTYVFSDSSHYTAFEQGVYDLGLSEDYAVSSGDLAAFENSLTPLETLSTMAGWFFVVVLIVGGIVLVVINIFNLRERKYEVGVLTAIGMKKGKVALQFICELLLVTFSAIIIGAAAGTAVSVPVTNALLENQIQSAENTGNNLNDRFGFGGESLDENGGPFGGGMNRPFGGGMSVPGEPVQGVSYIESVSSATNFVVVLELIGVGIFLTVVSGLAAMVTIMRYEPLKILSSRT